MQQVIQSEIGGLHKPDILERLIIKWLQKHNIKCSSPRRITENKRKIKQIPDNQALSGISFFWQIAENSRFKHIVGVQIVVHKSG
ncbi:hypothetical protein [Bacteroides uniformis]|uniref:hypothetical protein n=1 Tax=Bacteroides uniformis TaxID=820 RepID=UPI00189AC36F|nr:hypothetical protein [Bacteroides uniformis]